VTTTNADAATHTWTADDGSWDSGSLANGASSTHTFGSAGTFAYHCAIHPSMKGTVVVGS
jgi:plastocyanin